jgi:hypothetical protein
MQLNIALERVRVPGIHCRKRAAITACGAVRR